MPFDPVTGKFVPPFFEVRRMSNVDEMGDTFISRLRMLAHKRGLPLNAQTEAMWREHKDEFVRKMLAQEKATGVPDKLIKLLAASKKKDAEKLAKAMHLTGREFSGLIANGADQGWQHAREVHEFVPEHLQVTEADREAIFGNGEGPLKPNAAKAVSRIHEHFRQRLHRHVHLFERNDAWHIFFFSFEDAFEKFPGERNHWDLGTHVHYVSHLWGRKKDAVLAEMRERNYRGSSVHLRYTQKVSSDRA